MPEVHCITPSNFSRFCDHVKEMFTGGMKAVYVQFLSEDAAKTLAQNNTFHGLLDMWHKSGQHSFESYDKLRSYYKLKAGIIDRYCYIDGDEIKYVKKRSDIPKGVDLRSCLAIAGSWSQATKKQAIAAIDLLIADMIASGYSSKRFDEMLEAFNERWR